MVDRPFQGLPIRDNTVWPYKGAGDQTQGVVDHALRATPDTPFFEGILKDHFHILAYAIVTLVKVSFT